MPNTKEKGKLIEVLAKHIPYGYATLCLIADELMAEGVTFATDNNVGDKWISVKDGLPNEEYDWVLVQLKLVPEDAYGVPCVAELRNGDWYDAEGCWIGTDPEGGLVVVTHWMPLPEPPKGE